MGLEQGNGRASARATLGIEGESLSHVIPQISSNLFSIHDDNPWLALDALDEDALFSEDELPLAPDDDIFGDLADLDAPARPQYPSLSPRQVEDDIPAPDSIAASWRSFGLRDRPHWWHYWEERNLPPPLPELPSAPEDEERHMPPVEPPSSEDEGYESEDSRATIPWDEWLQDQEQQAPEPAPEDFTPPSDPPPRTPPPCYISEEEERASAPEDKDDLLEDNPSPTESAYYESRKARADAFYSAEHPTEDFAAPPLQDGPWNKSSHVSRLIKRGFTISVNENKRGKAPPRLYFKTAAEEAYINQMVADGILVEGDARFCVPHFFLYKTGKMRLIFNGVKLNEAVAKPPRFNMKSHKTIARLAAANLWHAADDLKNMFFSVKIAPQCRAYFGLRTATKTYVYTSLPFGFSWSPFMAHIAVDQICKRAIEAGHKVTHYLDDFHYFGETKDQVTAARDFTRNLLTQAGWRINYKKEMPPNTRFQALGVEYDSRLKASRIPRATISKLKDSLLHFKGKRISRKGLASIIGLLCFFNNATTGILAQWNQLINIIQQAKLNWKKSYSYNKLAPYINAAIGALEATSWAPIQEFTSKPTELFTDATPTQLGYVVGTPHIAVNATRRAKKQIYRAEADAIHWLLSNLKAIFGAASEIPKNLLLRCDNMALVHAIKKGRSNIFESNRVCLDILELRLKGHVVKIKHIPTEVNPADHPSRMPVGSVTISSGALCFA